MIEKYSQKRALNFLYSVIKELQGEGVKITQEVLAGLSPYRTHHINRFGDYTLNLDQEVRPMKIETKILD